MAFGRDLASLNFRVFQQNVCHDDGEVMFNKLSAVQEMRVGPSISDDRI